MVDLPVKAWLKSPQSIRDWMDETTDLVDQNYHPVHPDTLVEILASMPRDAVQITEEFSRTLIRYQNHQIRIFMPHQTVNRMDVLSDPYPFFRTAIFYGYDGTQFKGSQIQPDQRTIQGELENCLSHIFQSPITVHPASRTDAGVHALNTAAHFDAPRDMDETELFKAMSRMVPEDILIHAVQHVSPFFHARYDGLKKEYTYILTSTPSVASVHKKVYHPNLDEATIQHRLTHFIGTHDFKNFSKYRDHDSTVKTIDAIQSTVENDTLTITVVGKGFLRHMIRMMIGAALFLDEATLLKGLKNPDKAIPKHLAPAGGLYLKTVHY